MSYNFEEAVSKTVEGLGFGDEVESRSNSLVNSLLENGYTRKFTPYGGFDALVGVSVYTAARQNGVIVDPHDFERFFRENGFFDVSKHFKGKKIRRLNSEIVRSLDMEVSTYGVEDYISELRDDFSMSDESWQMIDDLVSKSEENSFGGHSARSGVAASAYIVSVLNDEGVTQSDVGDCLKVSTATVRNTYKDLIGSLTDLSVDDLRLTDVEITATTLGIRGDI